MSARAAGSPLGPRLAAHLRRSRLLSPADRVLVALSGGLDSVVLLHLLRFHLPDWRLDVVAAHFDHRMRDGSADDAAWVARLCGAWGVPLEAGEAAGALRSEAAARDARYAFLADAAGRAGAARIATAHHLDDQAETVLFRMLRGTGVRGLAGIPPRRGRIVRPLLPFRRAELEAHARAAGLDWCEDPTNRSPRFARNRIRLELLPALEAAAPGAAAALAALADEARAAEGAWEAVAEGVLEEVVMADSAVATELARARLLQYHPHIRGRTVRHLLRRHGYALERAGTRAALEFISAGTSGARRALAGGVEIGREFDRIVIRWPGGEAPPADVPARIGGVGRGEAEGVVGGRRFRVRWGPAGGAEMPGAAESQSFDPAAVAFPLELRGWRAGDRIRLGYGGKKLKKLFAERKVGRAARARLPVLAGADGRILWVVGVARAALAEAAPGRPVLQITVTDVEREGSDDR